MKKIILSILILSLILTFGCSSPKGDATCSKACIQNGFKEGKCETLSVLPDPCETNLNKTTIYSQEGYCPEYRPGGQAVGGVGNMCCCE